MSAGDLWRAYKADSRERRANNRDGSLRLLQDAGVDVEVKNHGAHLIVQHDGHRFDFWPGTGLWVVDGNHKRKRRGVRSLMKRLGVGGAL